LAKTIEFEIIFSKKISRRKIESFLALIAFFFAFSPFFSPVPIGTDVQPVFLIPILLLFFSERMRKFSIDEILFFGLASLSLIYINIDQPYFSLRKSFGLFIAFILYHFFRKYSVFINAKFIFWVVVFNISAIVFHYLFPNVFASTLGQFVRTIKY